MFPGRAAIRFLAAALTLAVVAWALLAQPVARAHAADHPAANNNAEHADEAEHAEHAKNAEHTKDAGHKKDEKTDHEKGKAQHPEHHKGKSGKNDYAKKQDDHRLTRKEIRAHIAKVLLGNLDLTDAQDKKIHKIAAHARKRREAWVKAHKDEMRRLRASMRQAREAKDKEKVKRVSKKFRKLMKSAPRPERTIKKVRAVLDKDQRTRFNKNLKKLRHDFHEYMRGGPDHLDGNRRQAERGDHDKSKNPTDRKVAGKDEDKGKSEGKNKGEANGTGESEGKHADAHAKQGHGEKQPDKPAGGS